MNYHHNYEIRIIYIYHYLLL